jgi:8-oxo-dGTP pyrophosphatase MutT (NUDIX family)
VSLERQVRRAARVLLLDDRDRVLLMRGWDLRGAGLRYWFTPGGRIDDGETAPEAAVRELAEETGLRIGHDDLVGPVHEEVAEFSFDGVDYRQHNVFYVVRTETFEPTTAGMTASEANSIDSLRWWSLGELSAPGAGAEKVPGESRRPAGRGRERRVKEALYFPTRSRHLPG